MSQPAFDEIRLSIGFSEQDAANVRFLAYYTAPAVPEIAYRLREQLLRDEEARALLGQAEENRQRKRTNRAPTAPCIRRDAIDLGGPGAADTQPGDP